MRKIFAGALIFSVIGAVILGGTLAWTNQVSVSQQIDVGSIGFELQYNQAADALLGPNGATTTVGDGDVQNVGDFNITLDSSSRVVIRNVDALHSKCDAVHFSGEVTGPFGPDPLANNFGWAADYFHVTMLTDENAPAACQGATISYDVLIVMATTGN